MLVRRAGLWLLVAATATGALHLLAVLAILTLRRTSGPPGGLLGLQLFYYLSLASWVVMLVGASLCAVGSQAGQRRWFSTTAIATGVLVLSALAPLIGLSAAWRDDLALLGFAAALVAELGLAGVAHGGAGSRRLARALMVALAASALTFLVAQLTGRGPLGLPPAWLALPRDLARLAQVTLTWFVALDLLGGFPDRGGAPVASLRTAARGAAALSGGVLSLAGLGLAAIAVRETARVSGTASTTAPMTLAIVAFVAGLFALRALRGRAPSPWRFVGAAVVLVGVGQLALGAGVRPAASAELARQAFPGLSLMLPVGERDDLVAFRERGRVQLMTRHEGLGLVTVEWSNAEADPLQAWSGEDFTETVGELVIGGNVRSMSRYTVLRASWRCPGDARWFTLELSRYQPGAEVLRRLGRRIFESIACQPATIAAAPPLELAFTPPPGARREPSEAQVATYAVGDDEVYSLLWSADHDLVAGLADEPGAILELIDLGDQADAFVPLAPLHIDKQGDVVETDDRIVGEVVTDDRRVLVMAWRCYGLDVDVVGFHFGPADLPRAPIVAALGSARCPR